MFLLHLLNTFSLHFKVSLCPSSLTFFYFKQSVRVLKKPRSLSSPLGNTSYRNEALTVQWYLPIPALSILPVGRLCALQGGHVALAAHVARWARSIHDKRCK